MNFTKCTDTELTILVDALSAYRASLRTDDKGVVMNDKRFLATANEKRQRLHDEAKDMLEAAKIALRLR
jgi:hypothetical protein